MVLYVLKRLLYAVPVILIVSVIAFFLSRIAPGDIVEDQLVLEHEVSFRAFNFIERNEAYNRKATILGKDLPAFYFSIIPAAYPDTLYRIVRKAERSSAMSVFRQTGSWDAVEHYRRNVYDLLFQTPSYKNDDSTGVIDILRDAEILLLAGSIDRIDYLYGDLSSRAAVVPAAIKERLDVLDESIQGMKLAKRDWRFWVPSFHWYGVPNQYHAWISGIFRGDFGISNVDGRQATAKITDALKWTLRINIPVILLAFGISIPLGVAIARRYGTRFDRIVSSGLFALYAVPSFWLATLCIVFLSTPEYGEWLDWFPTGGIGQFRFASGTWEKFSILISQLFLPVMCLLAGSLAYLTRQMRNGMLGELGKDYIRMARAKGLSERRVYWNHALRNALFPMITLVGNAIPAAISGSVIIEVLFNIPGMGRLLYESILAQDWNVAFVAVLLVSFLTVTGFIVSDILYRWVNPLVTFDNKMI